MDISPCDASHVDYPHHPGYLAGCDACERRCHCQPGAALCVYVGYHREFCRTCGEPSDDGEGWDGECGNCADRREDAIEERHRVNRERWEANHADDQ